MREDAENPSRADSRSAAREARRHAVLTAPLWMPSPRWSSRSIAESLGVSQSFVARLWRAAHDSATDVPPTVGIDGPTTVIAMLVSPDASWLLLGPEATPSRRPPAPLPQRGAQRLRTVVAADLVRPVRAGEEVEGFWRALHARGSGSACVALTSGDTDPPAWFAGSVARIGHGWEHLPHVLGSLTGHALDDDLARLESALRRWYSSRTSAFTWFSHEDAGSKTHASAPRSTRERALADDVLQVVRDGLLDGTLTAGQEISVRALAGRLHVGRARARLALRQLVDEGLLTATPRGAMAVGLPTVADIVELYVARRALGAIALRAAGRWTADGRESVAAVLVELETCAEQGDVDRAQVLDLAFQSALAQASGLSRIPGILESLADQLLIYISMLGVRYAFPPARILTDNTAIFTAIDEGDPDSAVRIWQQKMDTGRQYLLEQTRRSD